MTAAGPIATDGFEAAAWRRRLWLAQYSLELRLHTEPFPQDDQFDWLLMCQRHVCADMVMLRNGWRPEGSWLEDGVVADALELAR